MSLDTLTVDAYQLTTLIAHAVAPRDPLEGPMRAARAGGAMASVNEHTIARDVWGPLPVASLAIQRDCVH